MKEARASSLVGKCNHKKHRKIIQGQEKRNREEGGGE
jgi:hypothetical protein